MNVKRVMLRGLAVTVCALAASPIPSSFGEPSTVTLDKYAWWNANQNLPEDPSGGLLPALAVPAPPSAPDDGLYVESAGGGTDLAIAGVSYYTGGGVDATLTIEATAEADLSASTLAACPASEGWDAVQNGRWDDRPTYDPATCTFLGTVSGTTVTFSIPASAHAPGSGFLSLVIVPAEGSGTFSAAFEPPTSASLVTSTPASPPAAAPAPAPSASPAFDPGPASSSFDVPATGAPSGFEAPTVPSVEAPSGADEVAATAPVAAAAVGEEAGRAARYTAVAVLVAIGAALWFLGSRPQRAPRLLGSLGGGEVAPVVVPVAAVGGRPRGLGRFSRTRSAPPTAI